ncbi:wd40 repeat [Fusarium albosuccineum]|uniref:Wd40 repeat n=1 Tax=Fusarium albosuccineum TaxID=1237068 RepID=A0A8H4PH88_9HYPO|nr:wd40 repeat [Fusarium albosuccineum]
MRLAAGLLLLASQALAEDFTISNGQIFTPGFVVLNAPQPDTPLGGGNYATGRNFTISNGTASAGNASLGEIMAQEPDSTVKHVNWVWPDCLVGDGDPDDDESDRGVYNISIRQNFRLNGTDHYTIFDVPIAVTNSIEESDDRPSCDELSNELIPYEELGVEAANDMGVLFAPGDATEIETNEKDSGAPMSTFSFVTCAIGLAIAIL